MKNHNVSHIAAVISLSCTLRGFNVDPLYGRPKLCLTGLGPHNDSLICKLIQVCNWPSIETTGALNSKTLFFMIIVQLNVVHATETCLLCGAKLRGRRQQKRKHTREKIEREEKGTKKKGKEKRRKRAPGHLLRSPLVQ